MKALILLAVIFLVNAVEPLSTQEMGKTRACWRIVDSMMEDNKNILDELFRRHHKDDTLIALRKMKVESVLKCVQMMDFEEVDFIMNPDEVFDWRDFEYFLQIDFKFYAKTDHLHIAPKALELEAFIIEEQKLQIESQCKNDTNTSIPLGDGSNSDL